MIVEWTESALDRLADIVVAATLADQDDIEAATRRINSSLAADPRNLGESRSGNQRVWFEYPLVIHYQIESASGTVVVSHVARLRPRG